MHEHAKGRLPEIERICTDSLELAAKTEARSVERDILSHVLEHDIDDLVDD